ncbi:nuclear transport factor 2 family protein [Streptomyces sp. NPDC088156]|uniref:nuclear transport factor 2 family protein n=1 Tax=Streptomyces sp. NPDC088156 TaxID=3365831 RepID=UPI00382F1D03
MEKSFNERWSVGDNRSYLDNYAAEVSYFDPILKELIVGRDKVIAHLESIDSNPHIARGEYLNSGVSVVDRGDFTVLARNLNTYVLDDNGNERQERAWNATEAYRLIDGEWHIVHSNRAFTQTAAGAIASSRARGPRRVSVTRRSSLLGPRRRTG